MAMNALALFTLDQFKTWLKLPATDDTIDGVLEPIGNGSSDYCEQRIGQLFKSRSYTITRNGDGRSKLLRLPRPIQSVTSITMDGVLLDPTSYVFDADKGMVQLKTSVFAVGVANVVIALVAGYASADLPGHVVVAALDLAKSHYEEWLNGAISLSSISIGPASAVIKPGLNPRIEKFLDAQRDVRG
jgi:hypothetical protein